MTTKKGPIDHHAAGLNPDELAAYNEALDWRDTTEDEWRTWQGPRRSINTAAGVTTSFQVADLIDAAPFKISG